VTSAIQDVPILSPATAEAVRELARRSPGSADTPPLSEKALLRLSAGAPVRHLVAQQADTVLGYAQLDPAGETRSVELVATDPLVAAELLDAAEVLDAPGRLAGAASGLRLWAHGRNGVAAQAATQAGWQPVRTLLQLRRPLTDLQAADTEPTDAKPASTKPADSPTAGSAPAPGVSLRPFRPGQDDQAWLAVNARAFASHPEQGSWTQADLDVRMAASWFDPAGFLLAVRDGQLLGYHWTKVHDEMPEPMGEVYVLGVDPVAQGMKLGKALLGAGLRHLRERGLRTVLLYVEADNQAARALYDSFGFALFARDIQFAHG